MQFFWRKIWVSCRAPLAALSPATAFQKREKTPRAGGSSNGGAAVIERSHSTAQVTHGTAVVPQLTGPFDIMRTRTRAQVASLPDHSESIAVASTPQDAQAGLIRTSG